MADTYLIEVRCAKCKHSYVMIIHRHDNLKQRLANEECEECGEVGFVGRVTPHSGTSYESEE